MAAGGRQVLLPPVETPAAQDGTFEGASVDVLVGQAGRDLTSTPLTVSAAGLDLMLETPIAGNACGDRLQGVASRTHDIAAGRGLDAEIFEFFDIDERMPYSTHNLLFFGVVSSWRGTLGGGACRQP